MKCRYCDSFVPDYYNNCPHCSAQLIKDGFSEQHSAGSNKTPKSFIKEGTLQIIIAKKKI